MRRLHRLFTARFCGEYPVYSPRPRHKNADIVAKPESCMLYDLRYKAARGRIEILFGLTVGEQSCQAFEAQEIAPVRAGFGYAVGVKQQGIAGSSVTLCSSKTKFSTTPSGGPDCCRTSIS